MVQMDAEVMSIWALVRYATEPDILHLVLIRDISGSYFYWMKLRVRLCTEKCLFQSHYCSHLLQPIDLKGENELVQ